MRAQFATTQTRRVPVASPSARAAAGRKVTRRSNPADDAHLTCAGMHRNCNTNHGNHRAPAAEHHRHRSRTAGACRRFAKLMIELGWHPIKAHGLTPGGFRDQVRDMHATPEAKH